MNVEVFYGVPIEITEIKKTKFRVTFEHVTKKKILGIVKDDKFISLKNYKIYQYTPELSKLCISEQLFNDLEKNKIYITKLTKVNWNDLSNSEKYSTVSINNSLYINNKIKMAELNEEKNDNIVEFKSRSK